MTVLDSKIPEGPVADKWENHKFSMKLVNPNNKRRFEIIVVGTGLAGASAAASLSELGYRVKVFTFHDSPRRAHSIAAQGGINGAKNYTKPFKFAGRHHLRCRECGTSDTYFPWNVESVPEFGDQQS